MNKTIPGTDIEIGKWYPATQPPPVVDENFEMLLGIEGFGAVPGDYQPDKKQYEWHCQRYDDFDDENIGVLTDKQSVNSNLDWVIEKARGVAGWIILPAMPDSWGSYDGSSYDDPLPEE